MVTFVLTLFVIRFDTFVRYIQKGEDIEAHQTTALGIAVNAYECMFD